MKFRSGCKYKRIIYYNYIRTIQLLLFDKRFFARQNGTDGRSETFAQTKRHRITVFRYAANGDSETYGRVKHSRSIHVQRDVFLFQTFAQLYYIKTNKKIICFVIYKHIYIYIVPIYGCSNESKIKTIKLKNLI